MAVSSGNGSPAGVGGAPAGDPLPDVSPQEIGVLRPRLYEERQGEPSPQGTLGPAVAGQRVSGAGHGGAGVGA